MSGKPKWRNSRIIEIIYIIMNINDIPKKRDVEAMTNPKTQVSAEEFNTVVDATKGSVNSVGIGGGKALCLQIGTHGNEAHKVEVPNATEERAGAMGAEDKVLIRDLKAAVTENHNSMYPLTLNVSGLSNPYEEGVSNNVALQLSATHKGKAVTTGVEYAVDGVKVVSLPHTVTAKESKTLEVTATYKYEYLGEVQTLHAAKAVGIVCVKPCWIGGSAEASMSGKDLSTMGLTKYVKTSAAGTYTIALNGNGYLWMCVPFGMTIKKVALSGFDVPVQNELTVSPDGEVYRCYRSANQLVAGSYTVVVSV